MPKHKNKNKLLHLPLNLERSRMTTLALLAQSSQKPPESPSKTTRKVQARAATKERVRTTAKGLTLANGNGRIMYPLEMTPSTRSSKARITIGA
jgi:hypothetical protein